MKKMLLSLLLVLAGCSTVTAQTYEQLIEAALAAAEHDSLTRAESLFKQALKAAPKDYRNALVFNNLGKIQERLYWQNPQQTQQATNALESYTMALSFAPEAVPLLLSRANLHLRLEQYGKAILDLTTILDVAPDNVEARVQRAYCYQQQHRYDEARVDYQRILDGDDDHRLARLGMAMIAQQTGHLADAIERISLLITASPTDAELYSIRSGMYAENHQSELAVMDLDRALLLDPSNTNYLLARAYLHKEQGNRRLALADFEQAISLGIPRATLRQELKECR